MQNLIAWFVKNPIAANMLMIFILVAGFFGIRNMGNEMFPTVIPNAVQIIVPYPGAGSAEVEEQVVKRIEEAVSEVEGIKEIRSISRQGSGRVVVEAISGWDMQRILSDIKSKVDAINTFPVDAERPVVSESTYYPEVMNIVLSGNMSESELKDYAEQIKQDLLSIPGVGRVTLNGVGDAEVGVEISARTLRAHQLTFQDVADAIRLESVNRSAGQIRSSKGDMQIQAYGQGYSVEDFENIAVVNRVDGSRLLLKDLAEIRDTFVEGKSSAYFNGRPAVFINLFVSEHPNLISVSSRVDQYLDVLNPTLPETLELSIWHNFSDYLEDRLQVMVKNALQGLVLVFLMLMLFLRPILAFWVAMGLFVAYLGTFMVMSMLGVTLSVVSTFAFILILGIVVDDAIVVSEGVYANYEKTGNAPQAAIIGAQAVSKPVIIAVLTTMMVFVPAILTEEPIGDLFAAIALVVILALSFSLLESFLILPSHLSHMKDEKQPKNGVSRFAHQLRGSFSSWLQNFKEKRYQPALEKSLNQRGVTLAWFTVLLMVSFSILIGGWLKFSFFPEIQSEQVRAYVDLKAGESDVRKEQIRQQLENAGYELQKDPQLVNHDGSRIIRNLVAWTTEEQVIVLLGLSSSESRDFGSTQIRELWREKIGPIDQVEGFNMLDNAAKGPDQKDITLQLRGNDIKQLEAASRQLSELLTSFPGVFAVSDTMTSTQQEIVLQLRPGAETLGVTLESLSRQIRHAFYGAEVQRIPRLREDVRVLVRLPATDRKTLDVFRQLWIKTANGDSVPFYTVADIEFQPGFSEVRRVDRQRVINIMGNVDKRVATPGEVVGQIVGEYWPKMQAEFPQIQMNLSGDQESESNFAGEMKMYFTMVLMIMYTLLAVEFRSYVQPFIIMSAIPFGIAGAIIGHMLFGMPASMSTIMGMMATAGVVVNDNLVLLHRINSLREQGGELISSVKEACKSRFRPIFLTSLTTFFGLTPLLLERSTSTAFLKPMVVSLSFGVLLSTVVTLLCTPVLYTVLESRKEKYGLAAAAKVDVPDLPPA